MVSKSLKIAINGRLLKKGRCNDYMLSNKLELRHLKIMVSDKRQKSSFGIEVPLILLGHATNRAKEEII